MNLFDQVHRAIWMLPAVDRYLGLACFCGVLVCVYLGLRSQV